MNALATDPAKLLTDPSWYRALPGGVSVHRLDTALFAVTGNGAVQQALAHPGLVADHPLKASARAFGPNVLDCDGPRHRAFRALLAPVLAAGRIAEWRRELMPDLVDDLVEAVAGTHTGDFYGRHAHHLPYGIVCAILGVDRALADRFHELSRPLARLLDYPTEESELTHASAAQLLALLDQERARQRANPGSGSQSLLETIERTRDRKGIDLTDAEVASTALLFFLAGTETSSAFITSLVYCLGRAFFELDDLFDPGMRDGFIEETLRLFPPVGTIVRFAEDELELDGVGVPRHAAVLISLTAANRDPEAFAHPHRFDPARPPTRASLPFSAGAHSCPGAQLAKAEFALLLERLAQRCGQVVLTADRRELESQSFSRPTSFAVEFRPRPY
jgi:cytochrome P450